jgi:phosphoribosyl 1,2-cyclic phosphodiesterase
MKIYPGADLIECEIGRRPLHLTLLRESQEALLLDCGTRHHATKEVPGYLNKVGVREEDLAWLIMTHPDGDHCGGAAEIRPRYPRVRLACGDPDSALIESPEKLFSFRYDAYRKDHCIFYNSQTAQEMKDCSSSPQEVTVTFVGHLDPGVEDGRFKADRSACPFGYSLSGAGEDLALANGRTEDLHRRTQN